MFNEGDYVTYNGRDKKNRGLGTVCSYLGDNYYLVSWENSRGEIMNETIHGSEIM